MDSLFMLTSPEGNPAIIRAEEPTVCLSCLSKARRKFYCLFEDEESEEIVPICPSCFKEMAKCKERGMELMTEPERKLWHLMRFGPILGKERVEEILRELNAADYSYRQIRKKFLKRIHLPKDMIIDSS